MQYVTTTLGNLVIRRIDELPKFPNPRCPRFAIPGTTRPHTIRSNLPNKPGLPEAWEVGVTAFSSEADPCPGQSYIKEEFVVDVP